MNNKKEFNYAEQMKEAIQDHYKKVVNTKDKIFIMESVLSLLDIDGIIKIEAHECISDGLFILNYLSQNIISIEDRDIRDDQDLHAIICSARKAWQQISGYSVHIEKMLKAVHECDVERKKVEILEIDAFAFAVYFIEECQGQKVFDDSFNELEKYSLVRQRKEMIKNEIEYIANFLS